MTPPAGFNLGRTQRVLVGLVVIAEDAHPAPDETAEPILAMPRPVEDAEQALPDHTRSVCTTRRAANGRWSADDAARTVNRSG